MPKPILLNLFALQLSEAGVQTALSTHRTASSRIQSLSLKIQGVPPAAFASLHCFTHLDMLDVGESDLNSLQHLIRCENLRTVRTLKFYQNREFYFAGIGYPGSVSLAESVLSNEP